MAKGRKLRILFMILILVVTVGCDQTTKHLARAKLGQLGAVSTLNGLVELRTAENSGGFLSLGSSWPLLVRVGVFGLGTGAILLWAAFYSVRCRELDWRVAAGLSLMVAGGTSNLVDRVSRQGLVTDFIMLRFGWLQTGVFNFADVVVMLGTGLLILAYWSSSQSGRGTSGQTSGNSGKPKA